MQSGELKSLPILVVDDEPAIVSIIRRQFDQESLRITSMTDSLQALEALQQTHFALILSDNRMPGMTGIDLLSAAMARNPRTRRVLLTGYTDLDEAIQAFNGKVIHRYIRKPWNEDELLNVIHEELAIYASDERAHVHRQELERTLRNRGQQLQAALSAIQRVGEEFAEQERGHPIQRRLAAVIMADVVGYSRLMGDNPSATLGTLNDCRQMWDKHIASFDGRLVNAAGDSVLAEFKSAAAAVECAVQVQRALRVLTQQLPEHRRMLYRIGIDIGEVLEQGGDLYGDGVNIAARLEALAEPGEIWISESAYHFAKSSLKLEAEFVGEKRLRNIANPVRAYRVCP